MSFVGEILRLLGTSSDIFHIGGRKGPAFRRTGAALEARLFDDSAFGIFRAASPVGDADVATKQYVDELNKPIVVAQQFNGNNPLPANTVTEQFYVVTTTGANATIGQLIFDDGSGIGGAQIVAAMDGRTIFTGNAFNGGTISLEGRSYYVWNNAAAAWQLEAQQQTVTYWVNTATGNDANSGSQASPFATFAKAWSVVRPFQIATINLAGAQTFVLPSTTSSLTMPIGSTIYIVGVYASQLGARTALAAGSTTTVIQDTAGGLGVNASRGDQLVWDANTTTVALRGARGTVRSNTAGAFTLFDAQPAVPSNTDTFTIQRTTSVLQWTARPLVNLTSSSLYSDAVQWTSNAATAVAASIRYVGNGYFYARGSRWTDAGAGAASINFTAGVTASIGSFNPPTFGAANLLTATGRTVPDGQWDHGCFFQSVGSGLFIASTMAKVYVQNFVITTTGGGGLLGGPYTSLWIQGIDGLNCTCGAYGMASSLMLRATVSGGGVSTISGANSQEPGTVWLDDGAFGDLNDIDISNTSLPAIAVRRKARVEINEFGITGITGNGNASGILVNTDGALFYFAPCTVTGAAGDTNVDGVIRPYAAYANTLMNSGTYIVSTWSAPGSMVTWSGTLIGQAVGTTTSYFGQGGVPAVNTSSATALRFPIPTGSNLRNLRGTILANPLITTATFTLFKAPVATGVPASTALVVSVTAGTTGAVSDIAHVVTFQDGDQIDLQAVNTNGGATTLTSTWAAQAA